MEALIHEKLEGSVCDRDASELFRKIGVTWYLVMHVRSIC